MEAERGEDLAHENHFLAIVLSTTLVNGNHLQCLWFCTTKYARGLTDSATSFVENKES